MQERKELIMKSIKEIHDKMYDMNPEHYYTCGELTQSTNDILNVIFKDIENCILRLSESPGEEILKKWNNKLSTALELCVEGSPDYYTLKELYDLVNE